MRERRGGFWSIKTIQKYLFKNGVKDLKDQKRSQTFIVSILPGLPILPILMEEWTQQAVASLTEILN